MEPNRKWRLSRLQRLTLLAFAFVLMAAFSAATELTPAEKKEGLAELEKTSAALIEATKGLSEAQWNFKPAPDRWSVAEVLEHVVVTEDALREFVSTTVMQAPAAETQRDVASGDKKVLSMIGDNSHKVQAPKELAPTGRWKPRETMEHFRETRAKTSEFLKTTPGLRDHAIDSPLGEKLDGYQWVLYIAAHSERHTKQILEVKADPKFPGR